MDREITLGMIEGRRRGHTRARWMNSVKESIQLELPELHEPVLDRADWTMIVRRVARCWL